MDNGNIRKRILLLWSMHKTWNMAQQGTELICWQQPQKEGTCFM